MENKKEYCQSLYKKYQELKEKTKIEAKTVKPGGEIEKKYGSVKDTEKFIEIKEELKGCLFLLENDQLLEISTVPDFSGEVRKILAERRKLEE